MQLHSRPSPEDLPYFSLIKMRLSTKTKKVQRVLLSILFTKLFSLANASLLDPVSGIVSGVTGGGHDPSPNSPTHHYPDDHYHDRTDEYDGDAEYFTLEDLPGCGLNEYYEFCGSTCLESCKAFRLNFTTSKECKLTCEEGCFCEPGYRRHPSTGGCVLQSCCPNSDHEVYRSCDTTGEVFIIFVVRSRKN